MTDLLDRIVLPVADPDDAAATCDALAGHDVGSVVAIHVVEKAGGAPDKASVEQREEYADEIFAVVEERIADSIPVETEIAFGTDVAEAIFDVADDVDATAIVITPRGGSRWVRLLTGDVALSLVTETDRPVVVLPDAGDPSTEDPSTEGPSTEDPSTEDPSTEDSSAGDETDGGDGTDEDDVADATDDADAEGGT